MAGNITEQVKFLINSNPTIQDAIALGIVNYSSLAKVLLPEVEKQIGDKVSEQAVVMAARRHSTKIESAGEKKKGIGYEIMMTTGIFDVNMIRRNSFVSRLFELYEIVDLSKGEFLNITLGSHELSVLVSQKYRGKVLEIAKEEEIIRTWDDLVSISILFQGDFIDTPGLVYQATRCLYFDRINVIEVVSTYNVLTFVVTREESLKAYQVLESFMKSF